MCELLRKNEGNDVVRGAALKQTRIIDIFIVSYKESYQKYFASTTLRCRTRGAELSNRALTLQTLAWSRFEPPHPQRHEAERAMPWVVSQTETGRWFLREVDRSGLEMG